MCWFKKWFKKKKEEKPKKPDFSKYEIKINGKVMCAYEAMTGKPFSRISTEDDIKHLFYCSLVYNNKDFATLSYGVFELLISDQSVSEWLLEEYLKIGDFLAQFKADVLAEEETGSEKESEENVFYMLEALSGLIVKMGIDPEYVMYRMEEWEITYYYRMLRQMERERLTEERLWTYLTILPHCGKKLGSPEKMLPFEWEKNNNKAQKELEINTQAALAFLTRNNKNGTGEFDTGIGQTAVGEGGENT